MARLLMEALERAGHSPIVVSELRVYLKTGDQDLADLQIEAGRETKRIKQAIEAGEMPKPAIWFTYHPYYKSPDLIGPALSSDLGIPYVTAEASWARKRADSPWAEAHRVNAEGIASADLNLCFTDRDYRGLEEMTGHQRTLAGFPPFIDLKQIPAPAGSRQPANAKPRLLTVAMMRADVKLESYRMLAQALSGLSDMDWTLDIVGNGDARADVESAFSTSDATRVTWHGELTPEAISQLYAKADVFLWPGFEEAYGMVFLEAQAAGVPVVAQNTKGIPSVVRHEQTGLLTPEGDIEAFRVAIARLISDRELRSSLGRSASDFVRGERSLENAALRLKQLIGAVT